MTRKLLMLFAALLLFAAPAYALAPDDEAACDALGSECICSSTMDTNEYDNDGSGNSNLVDPDIYTIRYKPADENKECAAGYDGGFYGSDEHSLDSSPGFPSTATATYAWSTSENNGTQYVRHNYVPGGSVVRTCMRWYTKYAVGYDWSCDTASYKQARILANGGNAMFLQGGGGSWFLEHILPGISPTPDQPTLSFTGDNTGPDDCEGNYCRFEYCASGSSIVGIDNITIDASVTEINADGSEGDVSTVEWDLGSGSTTVNMAEVEMYREGPCGESTRSVSHFMIADWTTDTGQTIGAAEEIEGSASTPPSITGSILTGGVSINAP